MTVKILQRRVSRAAGWSRVTASFALVLLAVGGSGHRGGLVTTPPFLWILAIVGVLAVASLAMAGWGFWRLWSRGDRAGRAATAAAFLALAALSPLVVGSIRFAIYPRLSDISTDTVSPPQLRWAADTRTAGMNAVEPIPDGAAALQQVSYPFVAGRRYAFDRDQVLEAVRLLLAERGWPVVAERQAFDASETTIEAVARTFVFGFVDDVAVRVVDGEGVTLVDMRSASRYGRHDLGANAVRIRSFLTELDERLRSAAVE